MKNKYEIRGDVTAIILESKTYGVMETLISTSQLERVKGFPYKWGFYWSKAPQTYYVQGKIKGKNVVLHRWIINAAPNMQVDHVDHDGLNNTDGNLRLVTQAQNRQNQLGAQRNSKSGIRGVSWHQHTKKWRAKIKLNNKTISLGYYDDLRKAEMVVKEARAMYMPYSQESLQIENPNVERYLTKTESSKRSRSGHRNVYWKNSVKRWVVAFFNGKANKEFGRFMNLNEAIEKAREVRKMLPEQKSS